MTVLGCFFMNSKINLDDLVQKILVLEAQNINIRETTVILASRGIFESEVEVIEAKLKEKLSESGKELDFQWLFGETMIRCGLCHSVFSLKKLNTETVLCPVCEFKSVELLSDKEVNIFSMIG